MQSETGAALALERPKLSKRQKKNAAPQIGVALGTEGADRIRKLANLQIVHF